MFDIARILVWTVRVDFISVVNYWTSVEQHRNNTYIQARLNDFIFTLCIQKKSIQQVCLSVPYGASMNIIVLCSLSIVSLTWSYISITCDIFFSLAWNLVFEISVFTVRTTKYFFTLKTYWVYTFHFNLELVSYIFKQNEIKCIWKKLKVSL